MIDNTVLILENQIAIMWALIVDMPDLEIKEDLQRQIEFTRARLNGLK